MSRRFLARIVCHFNAAYSAQKKAGTASNGCPRYSPNDRLIYAETPKYLPGNVRRASHSMM